MTITEFLLARITEDEADAKAATPGPWHAMTEETSDGENIYYTVEHGTDQLCDMALTSWQGRMDAEHIARHDPARVLAECAAKRAIIGVYRLYTAYSELTDRDPGVRTQMCDHAMTLGEVLPPLAAVYKDHPDYRPEWEL
jgi:hypothetical protein